VDRLAEELTDHAADLFRENDSMDAEQNVEARLGTPEHLATAAKKEFQRRTFAGRYPILTFVAGPFVAMIGTFLVSLAFLALAYLLVDTVTGGSLTANDELRLSPTAFEIAVMQITNLIVRFAPFAFTAWLFVRLGRRAGVRKWSVVACGIVTIVAVLFWSVVSGPKAPGDMGTWMMGIGWRNEIWLGQLLQAVVPLACGVWQLREVSTKACERQVCT
jgi:hypothetical protein